MLQKTKNSQKTSPEKLADFAQHTGFILMTLAATIGMIELPDHPNKRAIIPNQPAFAFANVSSEGANPLRREREESAPHYISYGISQRTPGRTGKF